MPNYRRLYIEGGTYFFTVVTHNRRPIFTTAREIQLLSNCIQLIANQHIFQIDAFVIMPDHIHTIWTLPDSDSDYSMRWRMIKSEFSKRHKKIQVKSRERQNIYEKYHVWQRGFWEHLIRDQEDFNRHCDYIHFNPVKHGMVALPSEYNFSSFHTFVENGIYESDWGEMPDQQLVELDFE